MSLWIINFQNGVNESVTLIISYEDNESCLIKYFI